MSADPKTGINWPLYQSQVEDTFGDPRDADFAKDYLITIDLTEFAGHLAHVKDYEGNKWGCKIYGNYVLQGPLQMAFRLMVERGLTQFLKTYDGCFNIRQSKGGGMLSQHSWGLAVDFNAGSNGYGAEPSMNHDLVKCFAESGFEWGGLWSTPDGMHFQIAFIKDRTGPLAPVAWKGEA